VLVWGHHHTDAAGNATRLCAHAPPSQPRRLNKGTVRSHAILLNKTMHAAPVQVMARGCRCAGSLPLMPARCCSKALLHPLASTGLAR
jgi:hypothetical protein